jgi:hypothetical protein
MNERELAALAGIVDDLIALMNERSRRDGSHRPEDDVLADRSLRLREKLLADYRGSLGQRVAAVQLQNAVTIGNA